MPGTRRILEKEERGITMPIKHAEPFKTLGWYVECPYCHDDSIEYDEPEPKGKKIICAACGKTFLSGGHEK